MKLIIGVIQNSEAYVFVDIETGKKEIVKNIKDYVKNNNCVNLSYKNKIIMNGNVSKLPVYDTSGRIIKNNNSFFVLNRIVDEKGAVKGFTIAPSAFDYYKNLYLNQVIHYGKHFGYYNAKVSHRDGKPYLSALRGEFNEKVVISNKKDAGSVKEKDSLSEQKRLMQFYSQKSDEEVFEEFKQDLDENSLNKISFLSKKKEMASKLKRVMVIGLVAITLAGATGCSPQNNSNVNENSIVKIEQSIEQQESIKDTINSFDEITLENRLISLKLVLDVKADGQKLGTIESSFIQDQINGDLFSKTMTLKSDDGDTSIKTKTSFNLLTNHDCTVYDGEDSGLTLKAKVLKATSTDQYDICDVDGNVKGLFDEKLLALTPSASIMDADGNELYKISQLVTLYKVKYKITKVAESDEITMTDAIMMASNFLITKESEKQTSGN